ncbi:MAG: uracil-DNA glycosylase [Planctomycetia bacterium]|nr:uracil-DNA glycosylase [Planctomycetia bacterium]
MTRRAVVQRLQALRVAGVEEVDRAKAEKLLAQLSEFDAATSLPEKPRPVYQPPKPTVEEPVKKKKRAEALPIVVSNDDFSELIAMEDRHAALAILREKVARCTRCLELVSSRKQTVLGTGNPYARLMFVGEAPGRDEDEQGIPFVGRAGQLLTKMIESGMKISRENDTYICNILRCRPPGNRAPLPDEAAKCRQFLDAQIALVKPEFICCLGASAAQFLLDTTTTISRMRGQKYYYHNATVVCTYHPAYLLRNPAQKAATWQDLQFLMELMGLEKS